jgi:ferredoxin-thioredoxin reductase catalytic chain
LCPCRHYEDKIAEAAVTDWNRPCVPMRERQKCHCMLFLDQTSPFAGKQQNIEVVDIEAIRQTLA